MGEIDDIATSEVRHFLPLAVLASAMLHATIAVALLPETVPRHARLSERPIEVTLDLPSPEREAGTASAEQPAARELPPGSAAQAQTAPEWDHPQAAAAPLPVPPEPDVAQILPSVAPPPPVLTPAFGTSAAPPALEPNLEKVLPPVKAPPQVSGRDFAMTAPPALAKSPIVEPRTLAPAPRQPIRQARPKRASQQNAVVATDATARRASSTLTRTSSGEQHGQAQQDYLLQIIRKLSRQRFRWDTGEVSAQGLVVARLIIARDGRLLDLALAKSSGFPDLDRAVVATIRKASPFAPLPAEIALEHYTFVVPINYSREP